MIERPILFSGPMVRAILEGRKTQTRRVVKPQPPAHPWEVLPTYKRQVSLLDCQGGCLHARFQDSISCNVDDPFWAKCPHGKPGARLWVREMWAAPHAFDHLPPRLIPQDTNIHYAATEDRGGLLWRPSIHMPRWASRIDLEVTNIRVERLQKISTDDAVAEGLEDVDGGAAWQISTPKMFSRCIDPRDTYKDLWSAINGYKSWGDNPWVWVIEFRFINKAQEAANAA